MKLCVIPYPPGIVAITVAAPVRRTFANSRSVIDAIVADWTLTGVGHRPSLAEAIHTKARSRSLWEAMAACKKLNLIVLA